MNNPIVFPGPVSRPGEPCPRPEFGAIPSRHGYQVRSLGVPGRGPTSSGLDPERIGGWTSTYSIFLLQTFIFPKKIITQKLLLCFLKTLAYLKYIFLGGQYQGCAMEVRVQSRIGKYGILECMQNYALLSVFPNVELHLTVFISSNI